MDERNEVIPIRAAGSEFIRFIRTSAAVVRACEANVIDGEVLMPDEDQYRRFPVQ